MPDGSNYNPTRETRSTCPYCGVGCGVVIQSRGDEIVGVRGDPEHPANFGRLCTKGSTLHLTARPAIFPQVRALYPELRTSREANRNRTDWETVLDTVAQKIADCVQQHGPDSVGVYISGQLLTEDYYVFNKLAKGLLGTNNLDTNSRLCMSSAVVGYKQTLGADSVPTCYEDIDHADLLFFVGSNAAFAHPVLYRRVEDARSKNPKLRTIVVDPRRTDTAQAADLFLQIQPGTDVLLFHGLLHLLLWEGAINQRYIDAHTEGFAELKALVRDCTPKLVAQTCGIDEADLVRAAHWWAESRAVLSLYCQGLNQSTSGAAKNTSLINLHLATGQIGRPGAGPFSLTGQPNAMGGREVGGLANLLSAHRDMADPVHRAEVARLWGVDDVPATPGKTAVEMFEAAARGEIKVLWIACTNPAQSLPNQRVVREALARAELVILQDAYRSTATAAYADVLLPAASWGEKEGTVTNSERRISRVRAAVAAPGEARADWAIAVDVARRIEKRIERRIELRPRPGRATLFPYTTAEQVWLEHRESTRGRDLDITGLSYAILEGEGPQLWPYPEGATEGKARLYEDGVFATASGKAQFVATPYRPVAENIDTRYPIRDKRRGVHRRVLVGRDHLGDRLLAAALGGNVDTVSAESWLRELLNGPLPAKISARALLVPGRTPPTANAPRGRIICNCLNVGEAEIKREIERCFAVGTDAEPLAALQASLKCGTQCGSCVPELRRLIGARGAAGQATAKAAQ